MPAQPREAAPALRFELGPTAAVHASAADLLEVLKRGCDLGELAPLPPPPPQQLEEQQQEEQEEEHTCLVCHESCDHPSLLQAASDKIITYPCSHFFHSACILPWMAVSNTCPHCRHAIHAYASTRVLHPVWTAKFNQTASDCQVADQGDTERVSPGPRHWYHGTALPRAVRSRQPGHTGEGPLLENARGRI